MTTVSFMLSVENAAEASAWYERAFGARELWSLGSVRALELEGARVLLHEPTDGFQTPSMLGATTVRLEIFTDDPDTFVARAIAAGAQPRDGGIQEHQTPWGPHRQGGLTDPYGHVWHIGDQSPLGWRGLPPES